MKISGRKLSLIIFLLLLGAIYFYGRWLLQQATLTALKQLERQGIVSELRIHSVGVGWNTILLKELEIKKDRQIAARLPAVEIHFSLRRLLSAKRIDLVRLPAPEISINNLKAQGGAGAAFTFPFYVREIELTEGRFVFEEGKLNYKADGVDARLSLIDGLQARGSGALSAGSSSAFPVEFELRFSSKGRGSMKLEAHGVEWPQFISVIGVEAMRNWLEAGIWFDLSSEFERYESGDWGIKAALKTPQLDIAGLSFSNAVLDGDFAFQKNVFSIAGLNFASDSLTKEALKFERPEIVFGGFSLPWESWSTPVDVKTASPLLSGSGRLDQSGFSLKQLSASAVNYQSEDGEAAFSDAAFSLAGKVSWEKAGEIQMSWQSDGNVSELLFGSFYADLKGYPLKADFNGAWKSEGRSLEIADSQLNIGKIGSLQLKGHSGALTDKLNFYLKIPRLQGKFSEALMDWLPEFLPGLADAELNGALNLSATFKKAPDKWSLESQLQAEHLAFSSAQSGLQIDDLSVSLPLKLSSDYEKSKAPASDKGHLKFKRVKIHDAVLAQNELELNSGANRIYFVSPLVFDFAGGTVTGSGLDIEFEKNQPRIAVSLKLEDLDIAELSKDMQNVKMAGRIDGDLGRLLYDDGHITTEGTARVDIFGGELKIDKIEFDDLFSDYRTFSADVEVKSIDLSKMTHTFSFGEINGILDGEIKGLQLFGAVPSAFEADFETTGQGEQSISVKAINNIALISQGETISALSKGVYSLFDYYRYRKIGISCHLKNDIFKLEGTAEPGSRKYLIKGSLLPPKIDILIHSPYISFKEMLNRLKRLGSGGSLKK